MLVPGPRSTARQCFAERRSQQPQERLTLFRFPYGRCNDKALAATAEAGLVAVQWDLVTGDPDPHVSAKTIANTILTRAHPGAIVVAHANGRGRNTAAALAIALPKLKEQGYSFVTVSELLEGRQAGDRGALLSERPGDMTRIARTSARRGSHDHFSVLGHSN